MGSFSTIFKQLQSAPSARRAIQFHGEWFSWDWLFARAKAIESELNQQNIAVNTAVGLIPYNRPEFVAALMALLARGQHIVMIYAFQSSTAKASRIRDLALPMIIGAPEDWDAETLAACNESKTHALAITTTRNELLTQQSWQNETQLAVANPGIALLTSGTTGLPKQYVITFETLQLAILGKAEIAEDDYPWMHETDSQVAPFLHYMPLGNVGGIYTLLPNIIRRNPLILLEKFALADWLDYVKTYRPTVMGLPPSAYHLVLEAKIPKEDLASIIHSPTGAASLDPRIRAEFERVYDHLVITQSYGATEFCGTVALMTLADRQKFGPECADSVGRPFLDASIKIVDVDSGQELAPGTDGRIVVKSPRVGDHWIETNDLGRIDDNGLLYHKGRLDGAIMRGGFKIVPDVVSQALNQHPSIAISSVVGIADARLGQVPVAAYELRSDCPAPTPQELDKHLRNRLPATHIPTRFMQVDMLPRTPSMKIDSAAVQSLFTSGQ